jgi:dihydroxyacid dehydratase/phosphogluconate dehydratase
MVRISDARMSGTAYGTVILHVAPEAAAGGPLGIVQDGDFIELDAYAGKLQLDISEEEMQRRLAERAKVLAERKPEMAGGYQSCTWTACCRPTKAATSTSWSAAVARPCPSTRTDLLPIIE